MQLGNGRWENAVFNARLQPVQIGLGTSANAQELWKVNYDYGTTNNNGNVLSQQITIQGQFQAHQTYTYDSLNRLKSANETVNSQMSWQQVYNYDRFGNRTFDPNNTTTLGSCPQNQCNPQIDQANNRFTTNQGYTYDLSGNLITDAQSRTFYYDGENKQKEVRDAQNNIVGQYLYDGDGKRVKKISNAETTIFVYDGAGDLAAEYLVTTATPQAPTTSYLTTDTLGSPRVITDQAGNVQSRRDFMPFGEEISGLGNRTQAMGYQADSIRQKFTSYERDNEIDLDFAEARYFNGKLGRFQNPDPLMASASVYNPQSFNRYTYTINNPLNLTDPSGMKAGCPEGYPECYEKGGDYYVKNENGEEVMIDPGKRVTIFTMATMIFTEAARRTTVIIELTPQFPKQIPDPTPVARTGISIFQGLNVFGLIHAMGITAGCGAEPGKVPDGNGGCMLDPKGDATKMSDEQEDVDKSANPPDPAQSDTPSDTKKKKDKKKKKEARGGRGRFGNAGDSIEQLNSIEKRQYDVRSGRHSGPLIESIQKSKRRVKNDFRKHRGRSAKELADELDEN